MLLILRRLPADDFLLIRLVLNVFGEVTFRPIFLVLDG